MSIAVKTPPISTKTLINEAAIIVAINSRLGAKLTGSLMLMLRGFEIGRPPSDIDILINKSPADFAYLIVLPFGYQQDSPAYPDSIKFTNGSITVDFLFSNEYECDVINGIRCSKSEPCINAKIKYSKQGGKQGEKHINDIKNLNKKS